MGKSKKSRKGKRKQRGPMGGRAGGADADDALAAAGDDDAPDVVRELDSLEAKKRAMAAEQLAKMFEKHVPDKTLALLLRAGVARKLFSRLSDVSHDVRVVAAGALRNMSIRGGFRFREYLVKNDVVTPLVAAIGKVLPDGGGLDEVTGAEARLLVQVVGILLDVCESSDVAVQLVTQAGLVPSRLLMCLGPAAKPSAELRLVVCQILHTVTDNNAALARSIGETPDEQGVARLLHLVEQGFGDGDAAAGAGGEGKARGGGGGASSSGASEADTTDDDTTHMKCRVHLAGVLSNLRCLGIDDAVAQVVPQLLAEALQTRAAAAYVEIMATAASAIDSSSSAAGSSAGGILGGAAAAAEVDMSETKGAEGAGAEDEASMGKGVEDGFEVAYDSDDDRAFNGVERPEVERWHQWAHLQSLALEVLTNLCALGEDGEEGAGAEEAPVDAAAMGPIVASIVQGGLLDATLAVVAEDMPEELPAHISTRLLVLQERAASCASNMFQTFPLEVLAQTDVEAAWQVLLPSTGMAGDRSAALAHEARNVATYVFSSNEGSTGAGSRRKIESTSSTVKTVHRGW